MFCSPTSRTLSPSVSQLNDTDEKIIQDIRGGNPRRYGALVDRHKDRAMTLAVRLTGDREEAEELVQDAFVRAYNNLEQFRGEAKFGTWFYRILYNLCMTRVTRRRPKVDTLDVHDEHVSHSLALISEDSLTLERMEETELQEMIALAIENLPEKYKTPVTLFYVQEMSYDEIAEVLKLPVGTVKTNLFRGRSLLRESVLLKLKDEVKVA